MFEFEALYIVQNIFHFSQNTCNECFNHISIKVNTLL